MYVQRLNIEVLLQYDKFFKLIQLKIEVTKKPLKDLVFEVSKILLLTALNFLASDNSKTLFNSDEWQHNICNCGLLSKIPSRRAYSV